MKREEKFACTACSLCCRLVGDVLRRKDEYKEPTKTLLEGFPYKATADGSCEMLDEEGRCKVYDNRPLLCNIELTWEVFHKKEVSRKHYFFKAAMSCNVMIKDSGTDEKYLVNAKQYM